MRRLMAKAGLIHKRIHMSRIHLYKFPAIAPILAGSLIVVSVAAQSVINTFNFSPPGVTHNVGFDFRVAVVNSTGLVPDVGKEITCATVFVAGSITTTSSQ